MARTPSYTPQTLTAAAVLGTEIARARRARKMTAHDLAERAGVSRITVRAAEAGRPTVALGTVFELATLVGVPLFGGDPMEMRGLLERSRDRLALLPARVRTPPVLDDDF